MKLQKIIDIIETIAPVESACEWDNVGLMIGLPNREISKILISLDFDDDALENAIEKGADLIITHHPAIFRPIKSIVDKRYIRAIENGISVYSAHTNLDAAVGGVNYAFAECIDMYNCSQFDMMRVGYVDEDTFEGIIDKVKNSLKVGALRVVGSMDRKIKKVAVVGGAGGDFIQDACKLNCDLFITGECKYDQAQLAAREGINLIAAGHFETENPVIHKFAELLKQRIDVDIEEASANNIYKIV